jgi:hypothetical protein
MARSSGPHDPQQAPAAIARAAFVVAVGPERETVHPRDEPRRTEQTMIEADPLSRIARLVGPRPADLYDAWLFAAADATLALAAWRSARRGELGDAYATYVAALDREEQAAQRFRLRVCGA